MHIVLILAKQRIFLASSYVLNNAIRQKIIDSREQVGKFSFPPDKLSLCAIKEFGTPHKKMYTIASTMVWGQDS